MKFLFRLCFTFLCTYVFIISYTPFYNLLKNADVLIKDLFLIGFRINSRNETNLRTTLYRSDESTNLFLEDEFYFILTGDILSYLKEFDMVNRDCLA